MKLCAARMDFSYLIPPIPYLFAIVLSFLQGPMGAFYSHSGKSDPMAGFMNLTTYVRSNSISLCVIENTV